MIGAAEAATLALCLCCAPVFASSGIDVLCDNSADYPLEVFSTDVSVDVVIEVVDHGIADSISAGQIDTDDAALLSPLTLTPPSEEILRRIFDESLTGDHDAVIASPVTAPTAAPLAELTAPDPGEQSIDMDEENTGSSEEELPEISARLPGISEDETLRYRRQMFRTDI